MIHPDDIIDAVCRAFHVTRADIGSPTKRAPRVVYARRVIAYLIRTLVYQSSLPDIAEWMGRANHTSTVSLLKDCGDATKMERMDKELAA